jgi:hypothetical protein
MKRTLILSTCTLALITASCGENKTAESRPEEQLSAPQPRVAQAQPRTQTAAIPAAQVTNAADDVAVPPRDAQFTLVCKVIPAPGNVERAKQLKDELIQGTAMKGWYVSHAEGQSTLYYGYYKTLEDPRYKADRDRIIRLQDRVGNRLFAGAMPGPINAPDPTAPPEFNLLNAKGFWSLQIAAYEGAGRKEAAVEAVREARKMGVEAYYHHGPNVSAICIGSWPEEAIRKQELDGGGGVDVRDQERPLLVLGPGTEIPDPIKQQYSRDLIDKDTGRRVQVLEQKVEVIDPTFRAAMEKYPAHSVNGLEQVTEVTDKATGKKYNVPKPSMIVPIPHTASLLQSDPKANTPNLLAPVPSAPRGSGKLRSVGP